MLLSMLLNNWKIKKNETNERFLSQVGGEVYFSDIYSDRNLPESVRKHEVLWGRQQPCRSHVDVIIKIWNDRIT